MYVYSSNKKKKNLFQVDVNSFALMWEYTFLCNLLPEITVPPLFAAGIRSLGHVSELTSFSV